MSLPSLNKVIIIIIIIIVTRQRKRVGEFRSEVRSISTHNFEVRRSEHCDTSVLGIDVHKLTRMF